MKILTRYILKEMFGPTMLGLLFYTSIILMKQLFDLAGLIIRQSLALGTVMHLLGLSMPHIVVLTIPMSLLFGILIAVGRLSADSEIIAMRALGISTRTIYLPVFLFSFVIFLLNLYLMNTWLPRANAEFTRMRLEIATSGAQKEIRPRVFYDDFENVIVYVNDIEPRTGEWRGVFVADTRSEDSTAKYGSTPAGISAAAAQEHPNAAAGAMGQRSGQRVSVAQRGAIVVVKPQQQLWLNLYNSSTHIWDPRRPDRYDVNSNALQRIFLGDKYQTDPNRLAHSLREMDLRQLWTQQKLLARTTDRETYNLAWVEIHKKFSIPFACIAFGVLGLPLGITNRRGGKSS
ncbi:MAG TPA: LptF/LptG family permease, partial [Thermoanaerobaculia bacterium]|nr:LptF/LptG family permease [Thermoanaerobaculia bacterium]